MKEYPSIPYGARNITVYVFPKADGSNIRAEWNKKKGFWKFGSRHRLLDESDRQLGHAVKLFKYHQVDQLNQILKDTGAKDAMVFCEYYGINSSHGNHHPWEEKFIPVIDLALDKRGIILPGDFTKLFRKYIDKLPLEVLLPLTHEKWNDEKTQQVYKGEYPGQTHEGVVCKANQYESPGRPLMFKVKSAAWLKKLKEMGGKEE